MGTIVSISVLNIIVCTTIILGCVYAMYRLIKKCREPIKIKDSQNQLIGYKKRGLKLTTIFLVILLTAICILMLVITISHIFNIILIS